MLEWNEGIIVSGDARRGARGGSFVLVSGWLAASQRFSADPAFEACFFGFRVASVPEPDTGLLMMTALLVLAYLQRQRGHNSTEAETEVAEPPTD